MVDRRFLARRFEEARPRLLAIATRLLGSRADAEDVVQEAWLRLERADADSIVEVDAWLTTVVSRLALDVLRSARRRDVSWDVEPWPAATPDPLDLAQRGEAVTAALVIVLDTLSPAERLALVLHDVFGQTFDEVAAALGKTPAAARQLASRARRRVRDAPAEHRAARARERPLVEAWLHAASTGDLSGLLGMLDESATLEADYGSSAVRLQGREEIAGQAVVAGRLAAASVPVLIGGRPGVAALLGDRVVSLMAFRFTGSRITRLDVLADPARLVGVDVR